MASYFISKYALVCVLSVLSAVMHHCEGDIHRIRKPASSHHLKLSQQVNTSSEAVTDTELNPTKNEYDDTNEDIDRTKNYMYAILATFLVALTGILPLALPIDTRHVGEGSDGSNKLNLFLSFAVGGLLGDVFLHLLPEAFSHFKPEDRSARVTHGLFLLTGLFVFLIMEVVFKDDEKEHSSTITKEEDSTIKHRTPIKNGNYTNTAKNGYSRDNKGYIRNNNSLRDNNGNKLHSNGDCKQRKPRKPGGAEKKQVTGYLNLLANFIDNFTHGLAVGGSFMVSSKVGWHTTLAILLHEAPHEIGDFAILLRSGFGRWEAAKAQFSTSIGGLVGCSVALLAESADVTGTRMAWILPFTSGAFLNIALVSIVPDLMKETKTRESVKQVLCVLLGVGVMALVNLVPDH